MAVSVATVIKHVLVNGLAVYAAAEPIKPADAVLVLEAINSVLDDWAAETQASYAEVFTLVVTTGANPEVIGPAGPGAWLLPARPVTIDGVSLVLAGGIYQRLFVTNDPRWWEAQQPIAGGGGGGCYYAADEPNGHLYFNQIPVAGTTVRLMTRTTIGPVQQTDSLTLPPGYQSALELTVMEAVCDGFHVTLTPNQINRAGKARARIWTNNLRIPSLSAAGLGLPSTAGGWWDYRTGTWRGR